MLETADSTNTIPQYSNKLGNLIHLNTIKINHFANYSPMYISKCYQCENNALIINYNLDLKINTNIEYLNIFTYNIHGYPMIYQSMITFLNNLHLGLKYLQININCEDILNFITNLPITLEILNIVMLKYTICIVDEDDYKEYMDLLVNKIKVPFNCKINLKYLN
jgi:hypothetical protein